MGGGTLANCHRAALQLTNTKVFTFYKFHSTRQINKQDDEDEQDKKESTTTIDNNKYQRKQNSDKEFEDKVESAARRWDKFKLKKDLKNQHIINVKQIENTVKFK